MAPPRQPFLERFWAKAHKSPDGCWYWTSTISSSGYGTFTPHLGAISPAHRLAYELFYREPIPEGLTIDHLCRNRSCVNPAHLEAVTLGVNISRTWPHRKPREHICAQCGETYGSTGQVSKFCSTKCKNFYTRPQRAASQRRYVARQKAQLALERSPS